MCRRELDCKRQPVDRRADRRNALVPFEIGDNGPCPCHEEKLAVGRSHRWHREHALRAEPESLAARCEDYDLWVAPDQLSHEVGDSVHEVLTIVDDQENVLACERGDDRISDRDTGLFAHVERLSEGRVHKGAVSERRQRYPKDAVREPIRDFGRSLQRQPCLPSTARASEREDAGVLTSDQPDDARELLVAADERCRRYRESRPV